LGVLGLTLFRIHDLKEKGSDPQRIGIMVASHNEGTVRYAVQRYSIWVAKLVGLIRQLSGFEFKMGNINKRVANTL
jgi:hypothetical protein